MSKQEPSGEAPSVSVNDSHGVQVGSGNTMYANWAPKPPLDPAAMRYLDPHVAVGRLQPLSHDELVDFFLRAESGGVGDIIGAFLQTDQTKIVAALGDIGRPKATELISAVGKQYSHSHIDKLPEAAEATVRKGARLGWTGRGPLVSFGLNHYARRYHQGRVFWSMHSGPWATVGAIDDSMEDGTLWGFPYGDQEAAAPSPFGTKGFRQKFQDCMVYSSEHGTFDVCSEKFYEDQGESGGWLGFPVGDYDLGAFEAYSNFGFIQHFEGGVICSDKVEDREVVLTVRREVAEALPDREWRAVSEELSKVSSTGVPGTVQRFVFALDDGTCETAVYSPAGRSDPLMVVREVWDYYSKLGAEKSWLGFPISQGFKPPSGIGAQDFEGGVVYWQPASDPISIRKAINDFIKDRSLITRFGNPISNESPMGTGESDRIQFFKGGVVTLRDGTYEAWLHPY